MLNVDKAYTICGSINRILQTSYGRELTKITKTEERKVRASEMSFLTGDDIYSELDHIKNK